MTQNALTTYNRQEFDSSKSIESNDNLEIYKECITCNVCNKSGSYEAAIDVALIPSNIRKFNTHVFTVWRCKFCNSLHSKEVVDLEKYYEHYPLKSHVLNLPTRLSYRNRLAQLKKHGIRKHHTLLDYGCGTGLFVKYMREKGFLNSFGFDPFVDEYSDPSLLQSQYDIVTAQDVIEHAPNPMLLLNELSSLSKDNGLVVIGTPRADTISLTAKHFAPELHQPYHRHILSRKALLDMASKINLHPIGSYNRFYFDTPFPIINTRFMWHYININGGIFDVMVEPPKFWQLFTNPSLLWDACTGYFFPPKTNMMFTFKKTVSKGA